MPGCGLRLEWKTGTECFPQGYGFFRLRDTAKTVVWFFDQGERQHGRI